jgi:hypothetical protein|tara:strand:- start:1751 stop:1957 length:207 start_codon:yes stop_codon:yes gene_type:complete
MTVETALDALTLQTTELLDVCTDLKDATAQQIVDAVAVSENAAQIPLVTVATNLIDTQTLVVQLITRT